MKRLLDLLAPIIVISLISCGGADRLTEAWLDTIELSDATQTDTTVTDVTASRDASGRPAAILTAFFGLDNALPQLSDRAICDGASGKDGMPVVFSHEIDLATMQVGDFKVFARSGKVGAITCVTLAPANDPGEARTVLVVGQYGSAEDPPARVEVMGDLLSKDHALNFKGVNASVIALEEGPTLSLAEIVPREEWNLGEAATRQPFGGGSGCPAGTLQVIRAVWAGGITKPGGAEIDDHERKNYRVTIRGADGAESEIVPFALGDLGDGDNNHELCLDMEGEPLSVHFPAGLVTDPREDLNPRSEAPVAFATSARRPVSAHGLLRAEKNRIVDAKGEPVSFAGMSLFWSQWQGKFYNDGVVKWLKNDWNVSIVRAALGIMEDGYLGHPERERAKIQGVVDAAIAEDLYVIIDWHDHHAEEHRAEAVDFFSAMARKYGDHPHVIYEIYNEPLDISWSATIKPYAEAVIAAIREHDPDNLIVVGTPRWSQGVDEAAMDPLDDGNVAYTLHFYAGTHGEDLRTRARKALDAGVALFVTEWGTVNADGDGAVAQDLVEEWLRFLRKHGLTHLNWSVADKEEGAAILRPGASTTGDWKSEDLTESGRFVRELVREWGRE